MPLVLIAVVALIIYVAVDRQAITLEGLVRHYPAIGAFVSAHWAAAVLVFIAIYVVAVALSVPGATFLTVTGGFLFGLPVGAAAAVVGATIGATIIFLIARTALGEPLLSRAGPRVNQLAQGFRADAFSYLLFLRLVPAFPFFVVNIVPALAGVRLLPFVAATAIGIIPAALVYAFAGTGLGSVIDAQQAAYQACVAAGSADCRLVFNVHDVLTPRLLCALVALGLLALVPVVVRRWRERRANLTID